MAETKIRDFLQEKIVRNPLFRNHIVKNNDMLSVGEKAVRIHKFYKCLPSLIR